MSGGGSGTTPLLDATGAGRGERRRLLALHLPRLPTDRLLRAEPGLGEVAALATWARRGGRRLLAAVEARAAAAGLRPGHTVADAQAILPGLALRPADPGGDGEALHRLALWALRYTPLAAADPPDGLLLDVTGCAHLHGGERGLVRDAALRLRRPGFEVRAALAGAPGTAMALARGGADGAVVPEGVPGAEAVSPLPLVALRLPADTIAALHRLGLRRVGDLLARPRGPLALRFGAALVDGLDEAAGTRRRPLRPVRPPPDLSAARGFAEPVVTRRGIDAAVDLLLDELCRALRDAGRGARRVALLAFRVDGGAPQEVWVGTGLPTREPAHLRRLFAERLERLEPGDCGFERLALEARATDAMPSGAQPDLPRACPAMALDGGAEETTTLARLLDRLAQRLHVHRPVPRATYWPERAVAEAGPFEGAAADGMRSGRWIAPQTRPVRLLKRPFRLDEAARPWLRFPASLPLRPGQGGGAGDRVRAAEGPERFEPEWWRDRPGRPPRDYWRVELASGARLWVCRVSRPGDGAGGGGGLWFLHGFFA